MAKIKDNKALIWLIFLLALYTAKANGLTVPLAVMVITWAMNGLGLLITIGESILDGIKKR